MPKKISREPLSEAWSRCPRALISILLSSQQLLHVAALTFQTPTLVSSRISPYSQLAAPAPPRHATPHTRVSANQSEPPDLPNCPGTAVTKHVFDKHKHHFTFFLSAQGTTRSTIRPNGFSRKWRDGLVLRHRCLPASSRGPAVWPDGRLPQRHGSEEGRLGYWSLPR